MIYDEYLTTAELQRWILEIDVAWNQIDRDRALSQTDLLDQMHDSALIESYFPIYTSALMRSMWDQLDVTSVFSVQLYESYKHFYVLNRYLNLVNYRPVIDEELVAVRQRNLGNLIADPLAELTRYMISEHFAAYFFLRASRQAQEPVLAQINAFIDKDEFRHTQFASDLLQQRDRHDSGARERCLHAGLTFRHIGPDVVASTPTAEKNDLQAILTLDQKITLLSAIGLSELAQTGM